MKKHSKPVGIGKFFKKKFQEDETIENVQESVENIQEDDDDIGNAQEKTNPSSSTSRPTISDLNDLPSDPGDRRPIASYNPNQIDDIRRAYLAKGPFQPRGHNFPSKFINGKNNRSPVKWFDEFPWIEYSVKLDKAYCLSCYLFEEDVGSQGGGNTWSSVGFCSWGKKGSLTKHVGQVGSHHYKDVQKCENLLKQNRSIHEALNRQSKEEKTANYFILLGSVKAARFLLEHALAFRGHRESEESTSPGLFLAALKLISENNPEIGKYTLANAKRNNKLTSPKIQKEIIECFATEVTKIICEEIKDNVFGLLVDESSDVSLKEQMAVVVKYVDKLGVVKESFIGVVHVTDTSSSTLQQAIVSLLAKNQLSIAQVRDQGYDGASNMRGEFNGLKALILRDNPSAYYIHCFAHQLQLVIVAVARKHDGVKEFYEYLAMVVNTVSASCKRKDMLRDQHQLRVQQEILKGEIKTGKGLNQEVSLVRAGDTRWGSHHGTIVSLRKLFPEVVSVLSYVKEEGKDVQQRSNAKGILSYFKKLDFVFYMHLMEEVLSLTNTLSQHLQRKSQYLFEAAKLINGTKKALNALRQNGFDSMLERVASFCRSNNIAMLDMAESYGNPRNRKNVVTNRHHFEVDIFNSVLDKQLTEFGDRFSEITTSLLENLSGLNPCDRFAKFNPSKIVAFSEMYPEDFSLQERGVLMGDLEVFYHTVKEDGRFAKVDGLCDLARLMVETGKDCSFPLIYRVLKLALVLSVATPTVERCFSKLKLVKTDLHNRMSDDYLNNALVCAVEREVLNKVTNEDVMARFQAIKTRRGQIY